ncbi:MAG: hypothetical protein ACYTAF_08030 [Planctomycetota bacterium]|jgi:hypothetical protein
MNRTRVPCILTVVLYVGAFLAAVGGITLAVIVGIDPELSWLPQVLQAYAVATAGFLLLGVLGLLAGGIAALSGGRRPDAEPEPAPSKAEARAVRQRPPAASELPTLYGQVKTYIDLEMWELAYEKAKLITEHHPGTREARALSRHINELRWKAEPKFMAETQKAAGGDERRLVEKGLDQMVESVRTYMSLEMWELARQKAMAIMKAFPETPQSDEIAKLFTEIDRKHREAKSAAKPEEKEETEKKEEEPAS